MAGRVYCTYFDHNYLSRGLALYQSLQRHAPGSRLWVLCLSDQAYDVLGKLGLPHIVPIRMAEFEAAEPEVAATRATRTPVEYYFTCTPAWILFVAGRETETEWITYLDGDLYFFQSPEAVYDELPDASVAIIPHRYPRQLEKRLLKFGVYNVGWVGIRRDEAGLAVAAWWRARCIEWCHDYVDGDRFADQRYLDSFPTLSSRVKIVENVGVNLAPWNVGNYVIDVSAGKVVLDSTTPLIFFHFQGLRKGLRWFVFNSHRYYRTPFSRDVRRHIYLPYVQELLEIEAKIESILPIAAAAPQKRFAVPDLKENVRAKLRSLVMFAIHILDIVTGRAFLVLGDRAY